MKNLELIEVIRVSENDYSAASKSFEARVWKQVAGLGWFHRSASRRPSTLTQCNWVAQFRGFEAR